VENHITTEDYEYSKNPDSTYGEKKTLPKGSFIKPIWHRYVPKDIREQERWKGMSMDTHTFAFTSFGIILILKNIIRETV
jgi:hypothetical protein